MQLSQMKMMALKAVDRFFGSKNFFSDFSRQWAADTNNTDSGLANRCGNGGNGGANDCAVSWYS